MQQPEALIPALWEAHKFLKTVSTRVESNLALRVGLTRHATDNVMVGYGFIPEFAEFDSSGNLLLNMFYGSSATDTNYDVAAYRVFKQRWCGLLRLFTDVTAQ